MAFAVVEPMGGEESATTNLRAFFLRPGSVAPIWADLERTPLLDDFDRL